MSGAHSNKFPKTTGRSTACCRRGNCRTVRPSRRSPTPWAFSISVNFGQLHVWRAQQQIPKDHWPEYSLLQTWQLPHGTTIKTLTDALGILDLGEFRSAACLARTATNSQRPLAGVQPAADVATAARYDHQDAHRRPGHSRSR